MFPLVKSAEAIHLRSGGEGTKKMRREENFVDKSTWGEGEWQEEPDKVQYKDEELDLIV